MSPFRPKDRTAPAPIPMAEEAVSVVQGGGTGKGTDSGAGNATDTGTDSGTGNAIDKGTGSGTGNATDKGTGEESSRVLRALRPAPNWIITPEEVTLAFELAPIGLRAIALALDLLILTAGLIALGLFFLWLTSMAGPTVWVVGILAGFLLRNFYFPFTELRYAGRTIGKRTFGLRVVAADGGPLTADLVFARNLTREVEFFIPLTVALSGTSVGALPVVAVQAVAVIWMLAMLVVPLRNSHRARLGDLAAGTMVVLAPRVTLLEDLAESGGAPGPARRIPEFTAEQLAIYGITELQVLEDVLRRPPGEIDHRLLDRLAGKIQAKIGWSSSESFPPREFLETFYAAQRGRLEKELAFGRRRERKDS